MIEYTVKVDADGNKFWYLNDQLHREDGPAIEWSDGSKSWYLDGKLHREDGPAYECVDDGRDGWRKEDGYEVWYLNGKRLTEETTRKLQNLQWK